MQVTETSAEGLKREFKVVVPADEIEQQMVSRLNEVGASVRIPGFRPGKVPIGLLKKRFGDAVRGEVLDKAVQDSLRETMRERALRPAIEPKVEIVTSEEGADLEYKLAVEVMPEIAPPDFSELNLERRVIAVDDADVEAALARIAESQRSFAPVTDGRGVQAADQVVIDFVGRIDGEEFAGGSYTDYELEIGRGGFLPGFEEQLTGAKAGEQTRFTVTVPEDHANEQIRGKAIEFEVTVKEVRAPTAPVIDDEFAKARGLEGLDALKEAVRTQLEHDYASLSRAHLKRELLDKLSEAVDFPVPEGLVDGEFESIWRQVQEAKERGTLDEDDKEKSEEELTEAYRRIAERRVRLGLMLAEIGRTNNITVTQADLNRAMQAEAARMPGYESAVLNYYQNNPEAAEQLHAPIFEDKVVDFILEMAQVTERTVTKDELMGEPQAAPEGGTAAGAGS